MMFASRIAEIHAAGISCTIYNLCLHIIKLYPTADVELYKTHFEITPDEGTLMKGVFQTVPQRVKKSRDAAAFPISDGRSTRMAPQLAPC